MTVEGAPTRAILRHVMQVSHFEKNGGTMRLRGRWAPGYSFCMRLAWVLLLGTRLAATEPAFYRFSTDKYTVEMRVRFPASYEGTRLALSTGSWCIENFVGALAV